MHRRLTLTHENELHKQNEWGPQPETLKEFKIMVYNTNSSEGYKEVLHIQDHYQRQLYCAVQWEQVMKLRLEVLATNGLDHARIFEIRCY
ncbi:hypothetical protein D3C75_801800 [compost metagenome]